MIRCTDLTHGELVVLTEKDIERYIDIEIAHEGIMPATCPSVPKLEDEGIVQTDIAYEVGSLLFKNEEDAIKVSMMEQFSTAYDYHCGGYDYKWLNPIIEKSVVKKMFFKQSDVVRIKEILQRNEVKRKEYDSKKNEYDKFLSATGKIRDYVYSLYYDAKRLESEFNEAEKVLIKYRDLAENNEEVALSFFKNTYKGREDILKKFGAEIKEVV